MTKDPFIFQKYQQAIDVLDDLSVWEHQQAITDALRLVQRQVAYTDLLDRYEVWENYNISVSAYIEDFDGEPIYGLHGLSADDIDDLSDRISKFGGDFVAAELLTQGCLLLTEFANLVRKEG